MTTRLVSLERTKNAALNPLTGVYRMLPDNIRISSPSTNHKNEAASGRTGTCLPKGLACLPTGVGWQSAGLPAGCIGCGAPMAFRNALKARIKIWVARCSGAAFRKSSMKGLRLSKEHHRIFFNIASKQLHKHARSRHCRQLAACL